MASLPPPHLWFPSGGGGGGEVSSRHVITVASALRLGHLLRLRCSDHLRLLLSPRFHFHSQDGWHSDNLKSITEIWCRSPYLLKRNFLFERFAEAFSGPWSSCFSVFNGKESENGYHKQQRLPFGTSHRNYFDGRLWTNVILALNVLFYVAQVASQGKLTLWGAKVNSLIDKGQLWRLATSSFLHANIAHLMVNCYSLNSIGPTVEQLSGPRRFVAVYFTSALTSSLMSYRFCQSPAVGASGAIFGLVGSLAVFVMRHKNLLGGGKEDLQQIARVIALNMVIGLLSRGIDNWGHLGGLIGGAAISWFVGPAWRYKFQLDDGGSVFVDGAPIFRLIKRRLR